MVVGAKVCELTDGFLWFVCGLNVGILKSPLIDVGLQGLLSSHKIENPMGVLGGGSWWSSLVTIRPSVAPAEHKRGR